MGIIPIYWFCDKTNDLDHQKNVTVLLRKKQFNPY